MMFGSDVIIWFSRGNAEAAAAINSARERSVSIVSLMEILQGARSKMDMSRIKQSINQLGLRVLPLSEQIGSVAAALIEEHSLSDGLWVEDALIAATAIDVGEILATGNTRHFRTIGNLQVRMFSPFSA